MACALSGDAFDQFGEVWRVNIFFGFFLLQLTIVSSNKKWQKKTATYICKQRVKLFASYSLFPTLAAPPPGPQRLVTATGAGALITKRPALCPAGTACRDRPSLKGTTTLPPRPTHPPNNTFNASSPPSTPLFPTTNRSSSSLPPPPRTQENNHN